MDIQTAELLREIETASLQRGGVPGLEREAGQFLNILIMAMRATRILEVGTQDGYATLWLAEAAAATGGQVTTLERDVWQLAAAKAHFARSLHQERISLLQGEPLEVLPVLEGPFDFVLLDDDKPRTLDAFLTLVEKLSSGALICCDKAISQAGALTTYFTFVHDRSGLESLLVPIGEGIEVTYKKP